MGKLLRLLVTLVIAVCVATPALAQQRGTISGTVTTASQPLAGATVTVGGTALRGVTDQQGRFSIANVSAGSYDLTASVLGYAPRSQRVTVAGGETATANFQLEASALEIGGLVVTATGREQRQRELGAAVGTIDVAQVELAPVTSFSELIQGRVPGAVVLQSSGTTGTGSRIRIRGNNSISLGNSPLLIIDGVRVESEAASLGFGVGGQSPSRLNDINPEDIESVEVLKGPAASALYGTAAANGVIQVTTKRGRAGAPQFRAWSEYGSIEDVTEFPDNVYAVGTLVAGAGVTTVKTGDIGRCDFIRQGIGNNPGAGQVGCRAITDTYRFNPLENASVTPLKTGDRRSLGGSVSGGSTDATFYVSGEYEQENGVVPMNDLKRLKVQTNLTGNVGQNLNIGAKVGYIESDAQLPQSDNALFGLFPMALYGLPTPANVETNLGFASHPDFFYDWKTYQDLSRFTGSVRADYRPLSWLSINGTTGVDRLSRAEMNRIPRVNAYLPFGAPYAFGFIQDYNYQIYNLTTNGSATAVFNLNDDLVSTSSAGTQFIRENTRNVYAFGATLIPGIETSLAGATTDFDAGEANVKNATLSAYGQQQFAWRDRLFFTAAARGDKNTAFGNDIGWIWYPSFSASWVLSEEPFFPSMDWLSNFRLRTAWGQSGLRPGATDAMQSFSGQVGVFQNADAPAIVISEIGNIDLKPERSTEWELGFESGFLDNRFGLEMTYFNKRSEDALINRPLPPSLGASGARWENLGEVRNSGLEVLLSGQAVRTPNVAWNFNLSGSFLKNELVSLGRDAQGEAIPPIIFGLTGATQRHAEGYALGSWFQQPIKSFADANGDGFIGLNEVEIGDTAVFLGNPFPNRELSFSSDITLFRSVRLSALLDYKGGHEVMNFTKAFRCEAPDYVCGEAYSKDTPLETQAAMIGYNGYRTLAGFVEKADFVKLREVALTFTVPQSISRRVGSDGLSLTLAGRNLHTWTDYSGFDPEVNWAGQSNFSSGDATTLPPNRLFTVRIDANF